MEFNSIELEEKIHKMNLALIAKRHDPIQFKGTPVVEDWTITFRCTQEFMQDVDDLINSSSKYYIALEYTDINKEEKVKFVYSLDLINSLKDILFDNNLLNIDHFIVLATDSLCVAEVLYRMVKAAETLPKGDPLKLSPTLTSRPFSELFSKIQHYFL